VAQDCIIVEDDCGTEARPDGAPGDGMAVEVVSSLSERILGRTTAENVLDPVSATVLVANNTLIEESTPSASRKPASRR